jgi:hypothetical protein
VLGDFSFNTQYKWLKADLAAVNRTLTPWVIVTYHTATYHTYKTTHYKEVPSTYNLQDLHLCKPSSTCVHLLS